MALTALAHARNQRAIRTILRTAYLIFTAHCTVFVDGAAFALYGCTHTPPRRCRALSLARDTARHCASGSVVDKQDDRVWDHRSGGQSRA